MWDVDRLIELAEHLPVEEIDPDSIEEVDSIYWFDDVQRQTVRAVIEHMTIDDVDTTYPIILGPDGRVMDRIHRVAGLLMARRASRKRRSPRFRAGLPQRSPTNSRTNGLIEPGFNERARPSARGVHGDQPRWIRARTGDTEKRSTSSAGGARTRVRAPERRRRRPRDRGS